MILQAAACHVLHPNAEKVIMVYRTRTGTRSVTWTSSWTNLSDTIHSQGKRPDNRTEWCQENPPPPNSTERTGWNHSQNEIKSVESLPFRESASKRISGVSTRFFSTLRNVQSCVAAAFLLEPFSAYPQCPAACHRKQSGEGRWHYGTCIVYIYIAEILNGSGRRTI